MAEKPDKEEQLTPMQRLERSIIKKFKKEIWRKYTGAINDYALICDGDRIAVPLWGDIKSFLLLKETEEILRHGVSNFTVKPITVPSFLIASKEGMEFVQGQALQAGCNKIATTETFDDVIETILMNLLYEAKVETIMPCEGNIIRPLYRTCDKDILHFADYNMRKEDREWNITLLTVPLAERKEAKERKNETKALIEKLSKENKYVPMNIFRSVENVNLATLTGYTKDEVLHYFLDRYDETADEAGDE